MEFVDIVKLVWWLVLQGRRDWATVLAHIRETDAIVNVVRCFEDPNVIHVAGKGWTHFRHRSHQTELYLADLGTVEKD